MAEQGETYAKFIVGGLYLAQTPCRDDEKALRWTQEAANEGHRKAQFTLGAIYGEGLGVRTDLTEMESWYRKSAEQGLTEAQYSLARSLDEFGPDDHPSVVEATEWFRKAARQGHLLARNRLARRIRHGRGMPEPDLVEAFVMFGLVADAYTDTRWTHPRAVS